VEKGKIDMGGGKYDSFDTTQRYTSYCGKCEKRTESYQYLKFDGGGLLMCFECTPPEKLEGVIEE